VASRSDETDEQELERVDQKGQRIITYISSGNVYIDLASVYYGILSARLSPSTISCHWPARRASRAAAQFVLRASCDGTVYT
jgi:hypothetical protein